MQPKGFDTLDGPTPIPTRIVRCLTALAHFAQCKPHKIVNGVGEMCDYLGGRIEDVVFVARHRLLKDLGPGEKWLRPHAVKLA
jgi:hypothetical protein